jgi:hypothetical protein
MEKGEQEMNYIFVDTENVDLNIEMKKYKFLDDCSYFFYINKNTPEEHKLKKETLNIITNNQNSKSIYIENRSRNLLDTMIKIDISRYYFETEKNGNLLVISRDKGYDNFIKNFNLLTNSKIYIERIDGLSEIEKFLNTTVRIKVYTLDELGEFACKRLKTQTKPKTINSLANLLRLLLQEYDTSYSNYDIINHLVQKKCVYIKKLEDKEDEQRVYYSF